MRPRGLVIAVDGPSGAGKSTAGRALAARLGYTYVDTGAMYRALALKALRLGVSLGDGEALGELLARTELELTPGGRAIRLDGEDVTTAIRTREVSTASSQVSTHGRVRRDMVSRQQQMGRDGGIVMDGRDIGTATSPTPTSSSTSMPTRPSVPDGAMPSFRRRAPASTSLLSNATCGSATGPTRSAPSRLSSARWTRSTSTRRRSVPTRSSSDCSPKRHCAFAESALAGIAYRIHHQSPVVRVTRAANQRR